jgi:hypothetical protein
MPDAQPHHYEKPVLLRFGTFRDLTWLGVAGTSTPAPAASAGSDDSGGFNRRPARALTTFDEHSR